MDLASELAFYGAYHSNYENQLIHILCVPLLLWSALLILGLATKQRLVPLGVTLLYVGFYLYLDLVVGTVCAVFYLLVWKSADLLLLANKTNTKSTWIVAVLTQIVSWALQVIVGHAMYEKRKPALFDSLSQAATLAPLFVVYETLWMLIPGFQSELKAEVFDRIGDIHASWRQAAQQQAA
jgi:uncharacterized membrane protein YGL010W